jgi:hypothetical protein
MQISCLKHRYSVVVKSGLFSRLLKTLLDAEIIQYQATMIMTDESASERKSGVRVCVCA